MAGSPVGVDEQHRVMGDEPIVEDRAKQDAVRREMPTVMLWKHWGLVVALALPILFTPIHQGGNAMRFEHHFISQDLPILNGTIDDYGQSALVDVDRAG